MRALDGSIEWVSEASTARFISEGAKCLLWNQVPPPPVATPATDGGGKAKGGGVVGAAAEKEGALAGLGLWGRLGAMES